MSFDWNLSDGEEDLEEWTKREGFDEKKEATLDSFNDWKLPSADDGNSSSSSLNDEADAEGVDWEDAVEEDSKPSAAVTNGIGGGAKEPEQVIIDLNDLQNNKRESKPARKRRSLRFHLDPATQLFLRNLSRTHLLALVSRVFFLSLVAADDTLQAVLFSLFDEPVEESLPSVCQVQEFLAWFDRWQRQREERIRANRVAGAPMPRTSRKRKSQSQSSSSQSDYDPMTASRLITVANFLSDPDPQLNYNQVEEVSEIDRLLLFVALARSMGWRTRLVQALNPIISPPSAGDEALLDENHPLLAQFGDVFDSLVQKKQQTKKKSKNSSTMTSDLTRDAPLDTAGTCKNSAEAIFCWTEILCHAPDTLRKSCDRQHQHQQLQRNRRWIHVDPIRHLVNRPDLVEATLATCTTTSLQEQDPKHESGPSVTRSGHHPGRTKARLEASKQPPKLVASKKKMNLPVAYVVAVEHASHSSSPFEGGGGDGSGLGLYHITDVTPRYAHSWIASLCLRGGTTMTSTTREKKKSNHSLMANKNNSCDWWTLTLERLNKGQTAAAASPSNKAAPTSMNSGKNPEDAIVLDDDGEEVHLEQSDTAISSSDQPCVTKLPSAALLFDADEAKELKQARSFNEVIPTSKAAFATHPVYVIPSVLGKAQVLSPDAKQKICGVFKGECVYRRECVSTALPAPKWLYQGRKVRDDQLDKPVKSLKARKKPTKKSFQPLTSYGVGAGNDGSEEQRAAEIAMGSTRLSEDDGMQDLFAIWQTDPWSPPTVGSNDPIPVHETYKTIEFVLLNPGLVHIDQKGMAPVAKQLGIPYAPCLLGFEGNGGSRVPVIRGIVVHEHNAQILREANVEVVSHAIQEEHDARRQAINKLWKKLMKGLLVKDRIEREYGSSS